MISKESTEGLKEALLGDAINLSPDVLSSYRSDETGSKGAEPTMLVKPKSIEQLSGLVKWSRAAKIPLAPVSSGPPHYRGDTILSKPGIVVDMSGFRKIIMVNRRNRVALFEAGVGFDRLAKEAGAAGMRAMLPLLPRAGKSALAAYIEREPIIYPRYQWDMADPLLCLELVWGTGDIFRTGSAAGPGTLDQQWRAGEFQKNPMGPGQNDWMRIVQGAQGSVGIATWCSAKCEVKSAIEELYVASSDRIEPIIEASYSLLHKNLTDIHFMLDAAAFVKLCANDDAARAEANKRVKPWNLIYSISGLVEFPEERVALMRGKCERALKVQGLTAGDPPLGTGPELLSLLGGISPEPYWKARPLGGMREIFFQTTMDKIPHFLKFFSAMVKEAGIAPDQVATYIQPQIGGRVCHLEFIIGYDRAESREAGRVNAFADSAAAPLIEAGAFFSRPYGAWTKPAMDAAKTTAWIYKKVKTIFDPDGILAPGRLGLGGNGDAR